MLEDLKYAEEAARRLGARHRGLALLVLFGSRARLDARSDSDWDFAFEGDGSVDVLALRADLVDALKTDRVDLVDLDRASALLRYRVARDGVVILEQPEGRFRRFWMEAVRFWCDVEPLVRTAHDQILAELDQ